MLVYCRLCQRATDLVLIVADLKKSYLGPRHPALSWAFVNPSQGIRVNISMFIFIHMYIDHEGSLYTVPIRNTRNNDDSDTYTEFLLCSDSSGV